MNMAMRWTEGGFLEAGRAQLPSVLWTGGAAQASPALRDAARCRLCAREGTDERCFVKCQGEDHPACRACWEQLVLDPRRVIASIVRALI